MRNTGRVPEPTTYTAIRGGVIVFQATVKPGQNHSKAWHAALEA